MIIGADTHENPPGLSDNIKKLILLTKKLKEKLVLVGDTFNFLPYGYSAFEYSKTKEQFIELLGDTECILVDGNHDPDYLLKRMFKDIPNIKVCRGYTFGDIYLVHGHRYGPLWSWLTWFADDIVRVAMAICPGLWYKFSKWAGWMPSQVKGEKRYRVVVRALLNRALIEHDKSDLKVVMGHSHKYYAIIDEDNVVVLSLPPVSTGWFGQTDGKAVAYHHLSAYTLKGVDKPILI